MTTRQKAGVGIAAGGAIGLVIGVITAVTTSDPTWLQYVEPIVMALLGALGITVVRAKS